MEKYFIQCIEQAEVKNGMSLVIVDNGLKHKSKETKENLDVLEKGNLDLERKRKKRMFWIFSRFVCMLLHNQQSSNEIVLGAFGKLEINLLWQIVLSQAVD